MMHRIHFIKHTLSFFLITITLLCVQMSHAESDHPALALVKRVSNNMIIDLKNHAADIQHNPQYVYQLAYKHIVPRADIQEMSRRVLPPNVWRSMSSQQKNQFQREFTRLLVRTYASALTSYRNQTIRFFPIRSSSNDGQSVIQIDSNIIESGAEPLRVSYKLIGVGSTWKVIDLTVEGVSLITSFRSQFSSLLSQQSIDQVIHNLSQRN